MAPLPALLAVALLVEHYKAVSAVPRLGTLLPEAWLAAAACPPAVHHLTAVAYPAAAPGCCRRGLPEAPPAEGGRGTDPLRGCARCVTVRLVSLHPAASPCPRSQLCMRGSPCPAPLRASPLPGARPLCGPLVCCCLACRGCCVEEQAAEQGVEGAAQQGERRRPPQRRPHPLRARHGLQRRRRRLGLACCQHDAAFGRLGAIGRAGIAQRIHSSSPGWWRGEARSSSTRCGCAACGDQRGGHAHGRSQAAAAAAAAASHSQRWRRQAGSEQHSRGGGGGSSCCRCPASYARPLGRHQRGCAAGYDPHERCHGCSDGCPNGGCCGGQPGQQGRRNGHRLCVNLHAHPRHGGGCHGGGWQHAACSEGRRHAHFWAAGTCDQRRPLKRQRRARSGAWPWPRPAVTPHCPAAAAPARPAGQQ